MSFLLTVCISAGLGLLSGLGVGGGSLMILWLTLVQKMDFTAAKYLNLLFFLPPAVISTLAHLFRKKLSIKKIIPAALAGMVSASVFIYLSSTWDVNILRKLFGGLLLLSAWKELRYQNNQQESSHS
ncbi:MAG: TSUP family transporter [Firmicutes bacterium]|nr:TSUP family transporter [Bacillota bacterium]MDY6160945.1 TSUP family transporter [Candidatus Faecousia sp.]